MAETHCFTHVVGDEDDGHAVAMPHVAKFPVEQVARHGVEGGEWFVHEQQARVLGECAREGDALALASGQFVGSSIHCAVEPHRREQLLRPLAAFGGGHAPESQGSLDVLADAQPREERGILKHQRRLRAVDVHVARAGGFEPGDDRQQGRLAAAGGAENADELPLFDPQVEPADRLDGVVALAEDLVQTADVDGGRLCRRACVARRGDRVSLACRGGVERHVSPFCARRDRRR